MHIQTKSLYPLFMITAVCAHAFLDDERNDTLNAHDPSFGYVGFGLSATSGHFNLSQSSAFQSPGNTRVEPSPHTITIKPIPDQDKTGVGAITFSAHFGFMHAINDSVFTAGLFGGFNWSSLSEKWETSATIPEVKNADDDVIRHASQPPLASALHIPLSIEAGAHVGIRLHPQFMPFARVGWSLARGGVNRTGWVDRYRYTYFNGIVVGAGLDYQMTKQSAISLSCDWMGYGARRIRNFDNRRNEEYIIQNNETTKYNYNTILQSYVKPSALRFMLSIKYVLPNEEGADIL